MLDERGMMKKKGRGGVSNKLRTRIVIDGKKGWRRIIVYDEG